MNKKIIITGIFVALIGIVAQPTHAFWPFPSFGGQVKGEQTEMGMENTGEEQQGGFLQSIMQRFGMGGNRSQGGQRQMGSGAQGMMGGMMGPPELTEEKLSQAVTDGKITEEQKSEILSRQEAIKAKRQELQELEQSFRSWMQSNNINLGGGMMGGSGASGSRGMRPPMNNLQRKGGFGQQQQGQGASPQMDDQGGM